jgi:hypothetical protein
MAILPDCAGELGQIAADVYLGLAAAEAYIDTSVRVERAPACLGVALTCLEWQAVIRSLRLLLVV